MTVRQGDDAQLRDRNRALSPYSRKGLNKELHGILVCCYNESCRFKNVENLLLKLHLHIKTCISVIGVHIRILIFEGIQFIRVFKSKVYIFWYFFGLQLRLSTVGQLIFLEMPCVSVHSTNVQCENGSKINIMKF